MKEGWVEKTIGEVCLLKSGNSKANNSKSGELPYIKVGDMNLKGNETFITISSTYVDRQDNIKNIFPVGTLIFPKRGGAIFTNKKRLTKIEICCDLNVMGVIPNKDIILPQFLYYFFKTIDFNIFKDEGASIPQINNKNIAPILIYLPSLTEQQSIVDYLDSAFAKIDAMKANAEKALNEAKALFQASLKEMLEPKEGWEEKRFCQVIKLQSGDNLPAKQFVNGQYPVYGGNGIAGYHNSYNKKGVHIVIGRVGALCGNVHYINSPFWLTDNGFDVIVNNHYKIDMKFLSQYLTYLKLGSYARQAAQPVISNVSLKDIEISIPPLIEQQSIVTTLDSLKSKVDRLQENFNKISQECDALKQAILRQVFE